MKHEMKHKTINPTWKTAVTIYCAVLQNPNADKSAIRIAEQELLRLAVIVDNLNQDNK